MTNKEVNRQELRALRDTVPMRDLAATYIESLTTIINTLENQEEVTDILEYLTDRHLPRGVLSLHFQVFTNMLATVRHTFKYSLITSLYALSPSLYCQQHKT